MLFATTVVVLGASVDVAGATRSITAVQPVALAATAGQSTLTGSMSATVTEAAELGANPWTLTATLTNLTLVGTGDTIPNSSVSISSRATASTPATGMGTITPAGGTQTLAATRTLVTVAQSTSTLYTGTYVSTADLTATVPNGSHVGAYSGTLTITLIQ